MTRIDEYQGDVKQPSDASDWHYRNARDEEFAVAEESTGRCTFGVAESQSYKRMYSAVADFRDQNRRPRTAGRALRDWEDAARESKQLLALGPFWKHHVLIQSGRQSEGIGETLRSFFDSRRRARFRKELLSGVVKEFVSNVRARLRASTSDALIERYYGTVDRIDGSTAYVTMRSNNGEILYGKYDASELGRKGIGSGQQFECVVKERGNSVRFEILRGAQRDVAPDEWQQISDDVDRLLGDYDSGNDY